MNLSLSATFDISKNSLATINEMIMEARERFDDVNALVRKHTEQGLKINDSMMEDYKSSLALKEAVDFASSWPVYDKNTEDSISLEWLVYTQSHFNTKKSSGWYTEFM